MGELLNAALVFGVLTLIFLPLERLFPAHRQRVLRREWLTDLGFFLGQHLLWTAPVVAALVWLMGPLNTPFLAPLRDAVARLPWALSFLLVIFLSDLSIYWAHRLSHQVPLLWRFHRVHHTAERLDWLAAYREHPLDNLYTRLVENLPLILLGFPLQTLAGFAMFRGLWALYIHSNVSLMPGPLRFLLGGPRLHHWHHEPTVGGRVNFANLSPLMDLLFGTYHDPGHMPERYGMDQDLPHGYVHQLLDPLLPTGSLTAATRTLRQALQRPTPTAPEPAARR